MAFMRLDTIVGHGAEGGNAGLGDHRPGGVLLAKRVDPVQDLRVRSSVRPKGSTFLRPMTLKRHPRRSSMVPCGLRPK